MNSIEILRQFNTYNTWANERVLATLKESDDEKGLSYFSHILIAENTWLWRLQTNLDNTGFNFWQNMTIEDCEKLLRENEATLNAFLKGLTEEGLEMTATYKNSQGVMYTNTYREIFTHIFFHSAYHRGQIAISTRANADVPAYTDFIGFLRDR